MNSLKCPKSKSLSHCLTELFTIYQNKHWTIRQQDDHTVVPSYYIEDCQMIIIVIENLMCYKFSFQIEIFLLCLLNVRSLKHFFKKQENGSVWKFAHNYIGLIGSCLLKSMFYPLQCDSRPVNANPRRCIRELRINSLFAAWSRRAEYLIFTTNPRLCKQV